MNAYLGSNQVQGSFPLYLLTQNSIPILSAQRWLPPQANFDTHNTVWPLALLGHSVFSTINLFSEKTEKSNFSYELNPDNCGENDE